MQSLFLKGQMVLLLHMHTPI